MAAHNNLPPFRSVKETVAATGFSARFIRQCVADGIAPHLRIGTKILVNVPAFLAAMDAKSRGEDDAAS